LQQLGHSRSASARTHLLQTPDTFVRAPLPGMHKATAVVHISPVGGAGFTQYTVEIDGVGEIAAATEQRFVYVLDGSLAIGDNQLVGGDFAYLPPAYPHRIFATAWSRAEIIEKPYEPLEGRGAPAAFFGREGDVAPTLLQDDPWLEVRGLIPDDVTFDFRVNTMTYRPGATLPAVEMHVMEHGLLMLEGGGIYRLGDAWYPVEAGDFIWMAPYCPQWFGALGKTPAKSLIYKDWDRHPL
jgi:(S)-ureidoglycine aminohydrolase